LSKRSGVVCDGPEKQILFFVPLHTADIMSTTFTCRRFRQDSWGSFYKIDNIRKSGEKHKQCQF
jgi:hypothetical protein